MAKRKVPKLEAWFSIFLIIMSATVFWETLSLPPGSFDPLGSAGFPRVIAMAIGILALVILVNVFRKSSDDLKKDSAPPAFRRRPDLALGFYAFALVYVLVLALKLFSFAICTVLFLILSMGLLTRFALKRLPIVISIALVIGFGCQYVFTKIFVIDLP